MVKDRSYLLYSDNHTSLDFCYNQFYKEITLNKTMWIKEVGNAST